MVGRVADENALGEVARLHGLDQAGEELRMCFRVLRPRGGRRTE